MVNVRYCVYLCELTKTNIMKKQSILFLLLICFLALEVKAEDIRFISSETDSLFYEMGGTGSKTVLFLSGGPGASPESLRSIVSYVNDDCRTILMHQRGTGLSVNNQIDPTTINIGQYVTDINDILRTENTGQVYIVGHSWGAMLALDYSVKNPDKVKGLILLGSSGYDLEFVPSMNAEIGSRTTASESDSLKMYFGQLMSDKIDGATKQQIGAKVDYLILSKQFYDKSKVLDLMMLGPMNMQVNEIMMNDLARINWNVKEGVETLTVSTVIVHGSADPIKTEYADKLNKAMKNSELIELENVGHYTWLEKPEEVKKVILSFLNKN